MILVIGETVVVVVFEGLSAQNGLDEGEFISQLVSSSSRIVALSLSAHTFLSPAETMKAKMA